GGGLAADRDRMCCRGRDRRRTERAGEGGGGQAQTVRVCERRVGLAVHLRVGHGRDRQRLGRDGEVGGDKRDAVVGGCQTTDGHRIGTHILARRAAERAGEGRGGQA